MALQTRQRRPTITDLSDPPSSSSSTPYSKTKKESKSYGTKDEEQDKGLNWVLPLVSLLMLRYMSATSNILHDCDEVFNYWEPLHYLLYKSGFQTWEYSSQFALRSYLYILGHELVALPSSWLFGDEKVKVFYAVRLFLGLLSAVSETVLVVALSWKYGKRLASYTLAMLCLTSGCFFASTSEEDGSVKSIQLALGEIDALKQAMELFACALSIGSEGEVIPYHCSRGNTGKDPILEDKPKIPLSAANNGFHLILPTVFRNGGSLQCERAGQGGQF